MKWEKGQSGNPNGRPRYPTDPLPVVEDIKALARTYTAEGIVRLVHWMRSNNPTASVAATNHLLDRGWGKAPQELTGDHTLTVRHIVTGVMRELTDDERNGHPQLHDQTPVQTIPRQE